MNNKMKHLHIRIRLDAGRWTYSYCDPHPNRINHRLTWQETEAIEKAISFVIKRNDLEGRQ